METRKVMKGNHSRKTAAFVRVCSKDKTQQTLNSSGFVHLQVSKLLFPENDRCVIRWFSTDFPDLFLLEYLWTDQFSQCFEKK